MNDNTLLGAITQIAIEAGAIAMQVYEQDFEVITKGDGSPVTVADKKCEEHILAGLAKVAPSIPVLAEESASEGDIEKIGKSLGDEFFLVDPLDGTREFANRTGEFTVNIALIRQGQPIMGVVYAPVLGHVYAGHVGTGAQRQDLHKQNSVPQKISVRIPSNSGLVAVASRSHRSPETQNLLDEMNITDFTAAGSSLKFCLVAEGKADIYPRLGRTMEWDTAAGQAVLEAAGGRVDIYPEGNNLTYGKAVRKFDNPYFIAWGAKKDGLYEV